MTAALRQLGYVVKDREQLARSLITRVGPARENPWKLPVVSDPASRGVLPAGAARLLPEMLSAVDRDLRFRHVRFSEVTLGLFEEVLHQAISMEAVVGVGFDCSRLLRAAGPVRHVMRLAPASHPYSIRLLDDSVGDPPKELILAWGALVPDVFAVSDGFWIIGPSASMKLDFAPAWEDTQLG